MKLGKDTGSLVNWMLTNPDYVKPEVGMDVTEFFLVRSSCMESC